VAPYFGSAAVAIVASNIAVTIAAAKRAGNSGALQTFVTERLWKEGLIRGTAKKPIGNGWLQFPLWIKVPLDRLLLPLSSRR
jgi:hypothetical protein